MKKLLVMLGVLVLTVSVFGDQLILQPGPEGKDSHIREQGPTSNYGNYQYLTVNWYPSQAGRGLVQFEGLASIPANSTINSAYLQLYNWANNPNDTFGIYRITGAWDEMTVTWSNQPGYYATPYATKLITSTGYHEFDIKTLVQQWVNGTYVNYGFMIIKNTESGTYPYFVSSDYSTPEARPKLTVDYTPPTSVEPMSFGRVKALFH